MTTDEKIRKAAGELVAACDTGDGIWLPEDTPLVDALRAALALPAEPDEYARGVEDAARVALAWAEHYPRDVFSEDGRGTDAVAARMARLTCQNVAREIRALPSPRAHGGESAADVAHDERVARSLAPAPVDAPENWHLCRHDILESRCPECRAAPVDAEERCADCGIEKSIHAERRPMHHFRAPAPRATEEAP